MDKPLRMNFSAYRDEYRLPGREEPLEEPLRLDTVGPVSLASLRKAMGDYVEQYLVHHSSVDPAGTKRVVIVPARLEERETSLCLSRAAEGVDEDYALVEPVTFKWRFPGMLLIEVELIWDLNEKADEPDRDFFDRVLQPLLARRRARLLGMESREGEANSFNILTLEIEPAIRGQTISDAVNLGQAIEAFFDAIHTKGKFDIDVVADLVRSGRADLLLDQIETSWLEAKRAPIDLTDPLACLELAKDLSALANADGGLIILGLGTKRTPAGDRIVSLHPLTAENFRPAAYRKCIDRDIFPPIDGLVVEVGRDQDEGVFAQIIVPPQPEELKPFLVRRAFIDGRHKGAYIGVFQRREAETLPYSAERLHALVVAGRAALRAKPADSGGRDP